MTRHLGLSRRQSEWDAATTPGGRSTDTGARTRARRRSGAPPGATLPPSTLCGVAVRPIRIVGDPVLHTPTRPVTEFDDALRELVDDMFDTMAAAEGVGLAANQIGVPLRLFVYDCPDEELRERRRGVVVNPVLETSERPGGMPDPDEDEEGCLSVPFEQFPTGRADWARVTGFDAEGVPVTVEGRGYFARCLQHETDHLDGVLYLDRLIGRYRRGGRRAVRHRGWGEPGHAWDPAVQHPQDV
jgi:peptide deformylase